MVAARRRYLFFVIVPLLFACALQLLYKTTVSATDTILIPTGAVWKYWDNGTYPGSSWTQLGFNDTTWRSGAAQLGYGDGDEKTVVRFGPDSSNKYITTYFRKTFSVSNTLAYKALILRLLVDDGVVVYLNGHEILRNNVTLGVISNSSQAQSDLVAPEENTYYSFDIGNTLVTGSNILAVEVHQKSPTNNDLGFDASLIGTDALKLSQGPYLQSMSPNSVVLRWKTNFGSNSLVRYGSSPSNLNISATNTSVVLDHVIKLSGLAANTKYYYSIGSTTVRLAGANTSYFFITPPAKGSTYATRIWVTGDSGTWNSKATAVRNAYTNFNGTRYTNLWLMLGDNAYTFGTSVEYKLGFFNMYSNLMRQTVAWPAFGNHDGFSADSSTQTGVYYSVFTLPRAAEAGGLASKTEAYYSFDFANIHFVSLDSQESNRSPTGAMMSWLKNDIAATTQKWLIAFWHAPPYSHNTEHNSDTETDMVEMRKYANPILENRGVDLVMGGHSHDYERSFLIDGHYGTSSTFTNSMKINGGSGRADGSGAYVKPTYGLAPHQGAVYLVMGTSGKTSAALGYPAMYYSGSTLGSVVLDINGNRLDAKMLTSTGAVLDYFTIIKGSATGAPAAPSNLTATAASSSQINLAWQDNSGNESGFKIERSLDGTTFTQIATTGSNITSYSNTGLSASRKYYYRVRAYNGAGNSGYSNTASATTSGTVTLPVAPSTLTAAAVSKNKIQLNWVDNSGNESGFKIERSTNGSTFAQIATVGVNVRTFTDTGLKSNTTYFYRIRAYNSAGNSAYSNTASATTPTH